jgi:hypothetical protein
MVGCHILLRDCMAPSGPTGFVPRSHTSGQVVPEPDAEGNIYYEGRGPVTVEGRAGDIVYFVSDIWHRRMPGFYDAGVGCRPRVSRPKQRSSCWFWSTTDWPAWWSPY